MTLGRRPFAGAMPLHRWVVLAMALAPGLGCALLSRGSTVDVRWYTPELTRPRPGSTERQRDQSACELRFGRVTAGADLGLRIAYGDGLYQIGYYEGLRWTERPEQYVRRAVARALFEDGPFRRTLTGAAPAVDVEVIEFEEVKSPTVHAARIGLRVVVSADRVLLERTVAVSEPVVAGSFDGVVAAMSQALESAAGEIARDVGDARSRGDEACPAR
jgi:cholesterol transport system auxiliary component